MLHCAAAAALRKAVRRRSRSRDAAGSGHGRQAISTSAATCNAFERAAPGDALAGDWTGRRPALIGNNGIGLGRMLSALFAPRRAAESRRRQALAGRTFIASGRASASAAPSAPTICTSPKASLCVDDPKSPAYNTITSRAKVGWKVHGENMWRVPEYRPRLAGRLPDRTPRRAPAPASSSTRACRERPAPPAASRCRSARRGLAGFCASRRGAGRAAAPGARPLQGLFAAVTIIDRALGVVTNRAKTPGSRYRNARPPASPCRSCRP